MFVHIFLHLEQGIGLSRASAAFAFTVLNVANMGGRIAGGWLGDRYAKHVTLAVGSLGSGASVLLLALASSTTQVLVFAVIFGLCWGVRVPLVNSVAGDYFGRASYGKILGALQLIASPLGILGPVLTGYVADTRGDYRAVFSALAGVALLSGVLFFLVRPPAVPRRLRDEAAAAAASGSAVTR